MIKPPFMIALEKNDPALMKQMLILNDFASKDGALSAKVKTLMSMFGDAILGHAEGVSAVADIARAQGASEEEINETVRMAFLFAGVPGLVTATSAFKKQE
jgi:alkylhydroperoxidase/carboxymuconolactone decarboxylase family protein YurZ